MTLGTLKRHARNAMARSEFTWRYAWNARSALEYRFRPPEPNANAAAISRDLKRDGIAILPADDLLGPESLYDNLAAAVDGLETDSAPRIAQLRRDYEAGETASQKPFSIVLAGRDAPAAGIYTAFALQRPILDVVNSYMGMYSVLTQCQIWHNLVTAGAPSQSQLWHRDPEDRHVLKLFLYLSDVDEGAGPLTYARGSQRRPYEMSPHSHVDGQTARSTDAEMAQLVPKERWLTALAHRGMMVFADTRGYHKGGCGRRSERIVYMCQFLCGASTGIRTRDYHLGRATAPVFEPRSQQAAAARKSA